MTAPPLSILHIIDKALPSTSADTEQLVNTASALGVAGAEVTLLMPQKRGDPVVDASKLAEYYAVEPAFKLVQRPARALGATALTRIAWARRAAKDPLCQSADIVLTRKLEILAALLMARRPVIFDHYRPWPDDIKPLAPIFRRAGKRSEFLGILTHSALAANSYMRAGFPRDKLLVAHNGYVKARFELRLGIAAARSMLDLPADQHIAVYTGRINAKKGLNIVLEIAGMTPETLFLLVGSEGDSAVTRAAAEHENVRILPWQSYDTLPQWLYAANVLLIPPASAPLRRHGNCVLPIKLFSYLAAGRPILAPALEDTRDLLKDGENAILVPPDNAAAAAAALRRLADEPELAAKLGAGALETAETLGWSDRAARIVTFAKERLGA